MSRLALSPLAKLAIFAALANGSGCADLEEGSGIDTSLGGEFSEAWDATSVSDEEDSAQTDSDETSDTDSGQTSGTTPGETTTTTDPGNEIGAPLTISLQTITFDGNYAPKHVGAIWIETPDGTYVRTLEYWAKTRKRYLYQWLAASENDDTVADAMSGATKKSHGTHEVVWDRKDADGQAMGAGEYLLRAEFTEKNGEGVTLSAPFSLGDGGEDLELEGTKNFTNVTIRATKSR
jgi:hypothetical protein